jgi:hypothetical protein
VMKVNIQEPWNGSAENIAPFTLFNRGPISPHTGIPLTGALLALSSTMKVVRATTW